MKIAIDCRYIGKSGIGRVCEGILDHLDYKAHVFYLIGEKDKLWRFCDAHIIDDCSDPYSSKGIMSFPKQLNRICDCLIIPNFLIPYGVKIPVFSVMHDLAFLDVKSTTRGFLDRSIKKFLLKRCMKKSKRIACVSEFTRSRCEHYYSRYINKCYVNYNGLSNDILESSPGKFEEKENTLIYVGNVKPHKGLPTLLSAFAKLEDDTCTLKIIGEKDLFLTGLKLDERAYKNVVFTGRISESELINEIKRAKFLIQPSLYEGFGLPPLEALWLGTKPIVSDIPVFREVYSGMDVTFFRVEDVDDLLFALYNSDSKVRLNRKQISEQFNYKNCAQNIVSVIEESSS